MLPAMGGMRPYAGWMRAFRRRSGPVEPVEQVDGAAATSRAGVLAEGAVGAADPATVVLARPEPTWDPADHHAPAAGAPGPEHTEVLGVARAGAQVDPGASTQVLGRAPVIGPGQGGPVNPREAQGAPPAPEPLVSRRVAAEIGMYCGAGLALIAILGVVARGWSAWDTALHVAFTVLSTSTLLGAGLFLRLPWRRVPGDERRRAVSALLTTGVVVATLGVAAALAPDRDSGGLTGVGAGGVAGPEQGSLAVAALCATLAMLAVTVTARTPLAETALLLTLAWTTWVVAAPGPGTWAFLAALAVGWAGLGYRWARGRRTAVLLGVGLALACSVGMATGPWAWPTRAALAVVAVTGLAAFLRGRANAWLALGAGAATALAASVAGDVVGPALALLIGGLATMVVSGIALHGARPR